MRYVVNLNLVTSLRVRNGNSGITLTSLTTIADILSQKYRYRIDIGKSDIDPPLLSVTDEGSRLLYRQYEANEHLPF